MFLLLTNTQLVLRQWDAVEKNNVKQSHCVIGVIESLCSPFSQHISICVCGMSVCDCPFFIVHRPMLHPYKTDITYQHQRQTMSECQRRLQGVRKKMTETRDPVCIHKHNIHISIIIIMVCCDTILMDSM